MFNEKNILKEPLVGKETNEKNPSSDEMLAKKQRRLKRAIELLKQQGVDISEDDLDKE